MQKALATENTPAPAPRRFGRPTPQQRGTMHALGIAEGSTRQAAYGADLFAYVEDEHSTLRLQIAPSGNIVGQTVLGREPS